MHNSTTLADAEFEFHDLGLCDVRTPIQLQFCSQALFTEKLCASDSKSGTRIIDKTTSTPVGSIPLCSLGSKVLQPSSSSRSRHLVGCGSILPYLHLNRFFIVDRRGLHPSTLASTVASKNSNSGINSPQYLNFLVTSASTMRTFGDICFCFLEAHKSLLMTCITYSQKEDGTLLIAYNGPG